MEETIKVNLIASRKSVSMLGSRNHQWKGGRIVNPRGYVLIKKREHRFCNPNGYIFEHRVVWEEYNKACLLPWAAVHHINEDKADNRIENLQAMMKRTHVTLHFFKDMRDRVCYLCNKNTTNTYTNGRPRWYSHPITKQKWLCNRCSMEIYHKLKREALI